MLFLHGQHHGVWVSVHQVTPACPPIVETAVRCRKVKSKNICWLLGAQFELCSSEFFFLSITETTGVYMQLPQCLLPLILRMREPFYHVSHPEDEKHSSPAHSFSWVVYDTEAFCGMPGRGGPSQVVSEGPVCSMVPSMPQSGISGYSRCFCLAWTVM